MFVNRTVFILGAGASWHYGYPTGEDLVTEVIQKADYAAEGFDILGSHVGVIAQPPSRLIVDNLPNWNDLNVQAPETRKVADKCRDISKRLKQVRPPVIDYFLGHNPEIQDIGKLLIAWVILDREAKDNGNGNENRLLSLKNSPYEQERQKVLGLDKRKFRDNWYRFIVNKIVSDCVKPEQIHDNQVKFVTFNYDNSVEHHLTTSLQAYDPFRAEAHNFLTGRVLHVYGHVSEKQVGFYNSMPLSPKLDGIAEGRGDEHIRASALGQFNAAVSRAYTASKGIRVIDPEDKGENENILNDAKSAIQNAICVYILGYGFDENNSRRLNLHEYLQSGGPPYKAVMFTNYGDINRVNKKASMIVFGAYNGFLDPTRPIHGDPKDWYVEKSTRNVYDALELDFESLEQQLLAGSAI